MHAEGLEGWVNQDVVTYRGIGIIYRPAKVTMLKKKRVERGIWMKFRHNESGKEVWVASVHFPKNEPHEEYQRLVVEVSNALPAWDGPAVVLGDMNVGFCVATRGARCCVRCQGLQASDSQEVFVARGLMQIPPAETCLNMPTFVSRKSGVRPTQIDGVFAKSAACGRVDIEEGGKTMIESDRSQIFLEVAFRMARQGYKRKRGGVRVVVAHVPPF